MSERTGKIVAYYPANRQGKIQPDDKGPAALFYLTSVSNADPAPKENDVVVFDAPAPRKNKKGKVVQDQASSVTITERAPEPTPEELARKARKLEAARNPQKNRRGDKRGRGPAGAGRGGVGGERSARGPQDRSRPDRRRGDAAPAERTAVASERKERSSRPGQKRQDRQKRKPAGTNESKRPSLKAKVRYPLHATVASAGLHMEQSNPALVYQKYIQWPAPVDANKTDTRWRLTERNQAFFVGKTIAPLYRQYERKTLPWAALRSRREALLRSMERSGFHIASEVVRGPWRFAVDTRTNVILDAVALPLNYSYGYPSIPAEALRELTILGLANEGDATELAKILAGENQKVQCVLLDAMPTARIQQMGVERTELRQAAAVLASTVTANEIEEGAAPGVQESLQALSLPDTASFSFSIALRGENASRELAQKLLGVLSNSLRVLTTQATKDPVKEPAAVAQGWAL